MAGSVLGTRPNGNVRAPSHATHVTPDTYGAGTLDPDPPSPDGSGALVKDRHGNLEKINHDNVA